MKMKHHLCLETGREYFSLTKVLSVKYNWEKITAFKAYIPEKWSAHSNYSQIIEMKLVGF